MALTLMAHSPVLARNIIMVQRVVSGIIHSGWLELPFARTIIHDPKHVRAIGVLLYQCNHIRIEISYEVQQKLELVTSIPCFDELW